MKKSGMNQLRWIAAVAGFAVIALPACGSSNTSETDTAVSEDAQVDTAGDVTATTDAAADTGVCAKACKTPQGQDDLSLCGEMGKYDCVSGCCVEKFACKTNTDCVPRLGQAECPDNRFTCVCNADTGMCIQGQCTADSDCSTGQVCSQGGCIAAPATSGLHAKLLRTAMLAKSGQVIDLAKDLGAQAIDDKGNVVAAAKFSFAIQGAGAPSVTDGKITIGQNPAASYTVTAQVVGGDGKDSNPATIRCLLGSPSNLSVHVYDEDTLQPLSGKVVIVETASDTKHQEALDLGNASASTPIAKFPVDIHVFATDHAVVSVLGYTPANGTTGSIVLTTPLVAYAEIALSDEGTLVTGKLVDDNGKTVTEGTKLIHQDVLTGGITYSGVGEASLGLTSLAFNNSLLSFSIQSILGPNVTRKFDKDAPTFLNPGNYNEIPGGVTFGLGKPVITSYILSGTPGTHKVWTLAGHIELATIYAQIGKVFDAIDGGVDIGKIVAVLLPYLSTFYSQVVPDVPFAATVTDPLHKLDLNPQFPLLVKTIVTPPKLPSLGDGTYADLVFAIGGAELPSGEIVPLGLSAAADKNEKTDPSDGLIDGDPESPGDQPTLSLSMAPLHTGLQVGAANHVIVSAAVVLGGSVKDKDGNVIGEHKEGGSIQLTQPGVAPAALTVPEFLPLPIGSAFDPKAGTLKVAEVKGADFYRVSFLSPQGASWLVMMPKDAVGKSIALPDIQTLGADQDYRATAKQCNVGAFVLNTPASVTDILENGTLADLLRNVKQTSFTNAK